MIGTIVAHYRITAKLGEGAMGSVWAAEDLRLGRTVALKLLPRADDEEAVRRFEAEAQLASSINHPHIVAVYDIGEFQGRRFIAMEAVSGGTLRERLAQGRLKLRDALTLGLQLAEALAAAHRAGVVHRDVKPDNVLLTRDGYAKLGDFGIAKLYERRVDAAATRVATAAGLIVGSPNYLAPEQVNGEEIDARADIFAFAATLYEMATGLKAFDGKTLPQTLAKITAEDPPAPRSIDPALPPSLERVILKGLEKERDYRYQHMEDVAADLKRLRRDLEANRLDAAMPPAAAVPRPRRRLAGIAFATGVAAGALAILAGLRLRTDRPAGERAATSMNLVRVTTQAGLEDEPSWSADGRSLVYVVDDGQHVGLWVRQVPGERALRIGRPDVDEAQPAYSPDGNSIAFVSSRDRGGRLGIFLGARPIESYVYGQGGELFVMPALGGSARKLAEYAYDPSWSPDGQRIVFRSIRDKVWRLYTVPVDGGAATPVAGVEPRAFAPAWSPDGRWIAYIGEVSASGAWDVHVVPASGGSPARVTRDATNIALRPIWAPDGRSILYPSNRSGPLNLWRVAFDPSQPNRLAAAERITTGIGEDVNPAVASNGSIAYASVQTAPDIWRLDLGGDTLTPLTSDTSIEDYPRVSFDRTRLLFYSDRTGRNEVWLMDLRTGEQTLVSHGGATQNAWSPDNKTVAYGAAEGLTLHDLQSGQTRVVNAGVAAAYPAFSPDGRAIVYQGRANGRFRLYRVELGSGKSEILPTAEGEPGDPSWAPDGQTLWFQLDRLGERNIWSLDFTTSQSRQITTGDLDDAHPDVSSDGRTLLFLRNHAELHVMPAAGGSSRLVRRFARRLVEWPHWVPGEHAIVFSLTDKRGDVFVLQPDRPTARVP